MTHGYLSMSDHLFQELCVTFALNVGIWPAYRMFLLGLFWSIKLLIQKKKTEHIIIRTTA